MINEKCVAKWIKTHHEKTGSNKSDSVKFHLCEKFASVDKARCCF